MEGLNKHLGTGVLATGETAGPMEGHLDMRMLGHFQLKGFQKAVAVYELIGAIDQADETRPWRETFAAGLKHFRNKNLADARASFVQTLELRPGDGPSLFYIGFMGEMMPELMPDDWKGEVEIREK